MPGIVGIVGPEPGSLPHDGKLATLAEPLVFSPEQEVQWFRHSWYCAGTVGYGRSFSFLKKADAYQDGVLLIMDGEVFPDASEVPNELSTPAPTIQRAEYCLHLYLRHGPLFAERLNGNFVIAVLDSRDRMVHLYNDRFGSEPLYLWTAEGAFAFATSLRSLLLYRDSIGREYDKDALTELIVFERVLGDKTLFRDIRRLVPASHAIWSGTHLATAKYWSIPACQRSEEWRDWRDAAVELNHRVKRTVGKRSGDGAQIGTLVSGGIDSRLLLALCPRGTWAATFTNRGHPHSTETLLAMKVAHVLGFEHKCIARAIDHYADVAESAVDANEAQMSFINSHSLGLHQQMLDEGIQVILTAFWWDTLFKDYYLLGNLTDTPYPDEPSVLKSRRIAWHLVYSGTIRKVHHQHLMMLALTQEMKERAAFVKESLIGQLSRMLSEGSECDGRLEHTGLCDFQSDAAIGFQRGLRTHFLDRSPAFDNDLLMLSLQIPTAWKKDGRIVRYALKLTDRRLAWIQDANTGLPAGLCPPWNRILGTVRQSVRRTARQWVRMSKTIIGAGQTAGRCRVFLGHDSWHDMNGMIRLCPRYRAMIERTVERLDETIFDKKVVAELLHDDLSATAPRLRKLFEILLTFGLFDDKYGPSRSRNAASGSIADMRLVDLRGAASKNP